jgi:hypothetical protein
MRCLSCDSILSDFEATRKGAFSGQYIDMCNSCFNTINDNVLSIDRSDLEHDSDSFDQELDDPLDNEHDSL